MNFGQHNALDWDLNCECRRCQLEYAAKQRLIREPAPGRQRRQLFSRFRWHHDEDARINRPHRDDEQEVEWLNMNDAIRMRG